MIRKVRHILLFLCAAGLMASCVSNKKMIYLQGAKDTYAVPQEIQQAFEMTVQPDDQLAISVTSKRPELIQPFNNNTLIGSGANSISGSNTANTTSGVSYFQVDKQGNIEFPIFGTLHVGGLTTRQVSSLVQKRLIDENYIKDAVVNTKVMSFKVTVLGDVRNPGMQTYQGERLTLLEALGKAGDLTNTALRENVLVMREENGQRTAYEVDLRSHESVFGSPAYYLQQNDVVYVQSNKSQRVKGSTGYTWISVGSTLVGVAVSVISLIIAIKRS